MRPFQHGLLILFLQFYIYWNLLYLCNVAYAVLTINKVKLTTQKRDTTKQNDKVITKDVFMMLAKYLMAKLKKLEKLS